MFCKEKGVKVLNLKDILRRIAVERIINKEEMVKLIRDIEDKDRTIIIGTNDILGGYK
ncbi:MAG: hypothetical protein WA977_03120 [Halobacteriota archaeon]